MADLHASGGIRSSICRSTCIGVSCSFETLFRHLRELSTDMIPNVTKMLTAKYKRFTGTLDSNQKGFPNKFQQFGSSNTFIKVTGSCLKHAFLFEETVTYGDGVSKHATTHVNQIMPPRFKMPCFEVVQNDLKLFDKTFRNSHFFEDVKYKDILYNNAGERDKKYCELMHLSCTLTHVFCQCLARCNASQRSFEHCHGMNDRLKQKKETKWGEV